MAAAMPNIPIMEVCQAPYHPLYWELTAPPFQIEDGYVYVPQGSGLGVEFDPEMEKRFPYQESPSLLAF
jgi:L-alanine-DL-glutamate epimerase-like enolase superfamily enzyme